MLKMKFRVDFKLKWQKYKAKLKDIGREFDHKPFEILEMRPPRVSRNMFLQIIEDFFYCMTVRHLRNHLSNFLSQNKDYSFSFNSLEEQQRLKSFSDLYLQAREYRHFNPLVDFLPNFEKKVKKIRKSETWNFLTKKKKNFSVSSSDSDFLEKDLEILMPESMIIALIFLSHNVPPLISLGMLNSDHNSSPKMILI